MSVSSHHKFRLGKVKSFNLTAGDVDHFTDRLTDKLEAPSRFGFLRAALLHVVNRFVAVILILFLSPVLVVVSLIIRAETQGRAIDVFGCTHPRSGRFRAFAFRCTKAGKDMGIPSRIGQGLQELGIDQLPLLFNVAKGDVLLGEAFAFGKIHGQLMNEQSAETKSYKALYLSNRISPGGLYSDLFKRGVDVGLIVLASPVILTVIGIVYLLARSDGGPGFYSQRRTGQDGKQFSCWKIRTMGVDAEARLTHYLASNPQAATEWAGAHKLVDDPRVTKIGRILRKASLDEFPQFWNVLRGEMSLVGPRPVTYPELEKYKENVSLYLLAQPGITGAWQVCGRSDTTYDERVALDAAYVRNRSFFLDIKLLFQTVFTIIRKTGR